MANPAIDNEWETVPSPSAPTSATDSEWETVATPPEGALVSLLHGAAKSAATIPAFLASYVPGPIGENARQVLARANAPAANAYQGIGKFGEQALEFAIPGGAASKAMEAAPFLARAATQAGIGAGVSGLQTRGDPRSMAIGGVLGVGGEAAGSAIGRIRALAQLPKAATVENFRDAFAATPMQLPAIQKAMPTLAKYGSTPQAGVQEMQDAVRGQLQDLSQQYATREAAGIGDKTMAGNDIVQKLEQLKSRFTTSSGKVPSANKEIVSRIEEQIADVKGEMDTGGNVKFRDLRTLRDASNGKTNWASPEADQNLYRDVGDIYRGGLDQIEPGTAELNRDWANLTAADKVADKNISYGRGIVPSRFEQGLQKATQPAVGMMLGREGSSLIPVDFPGKALAFEAAGGYLYPKLAGPVVQALKNAADSGQLGALPTAQRAALSMAAKLGDNAAILRILGQGAATTAVEQRRPGP